MVRPMKIRNKYFFIRYITNRPKFEAVENGIPFRPGDKVRFKGGDVVEVVEVISKDGIIKTSDGNSYYTYKGKLDFDD